MQQENKGGGKEMNESVYGLRRMADFEIAQMLNEERARFRRMKFFLYLLGVITLLMIGAIIYYAGIDETVCCILLIITGVYIPALFFLLIGSYLDSRGIISSHIVPQ